jgi:general stress protein 26
MLIYFTTNKNTETVLEVSKDVRLEVNAEIAK